MCRTFSDRGTQRGSTGGGLDKYENLLDYAWTGICVCAEREGEREGVDGAKWIFVRQFIEHVVYIAVRYTKGACQSHNKEKCLARKLPQGQYGERGEGQHLLHL